MPHLCDGGRFIDLTTTYCNDFPSTMQARRRNDFCASHDTTWRVTDIQNEEAVGYLPGALVARNKTVGSRRRSRQQAFHSLTTFLWLHCGSSTTHSASATAIET
jgi:hypothetical protein